jgi:superfamily I DNA/RNA helicase
MTVAHLVRKPGSARGTEEWDAAGTRVLEHPGGFLRVLGGPGTGKTTLLAELAARRVPESEAGSTDRVLVLTASRRAALSLRSRIAERRRSVAAVTTVAEPLVRTVHSYAFAVLRRAAVLRVDPPPRLLSGPEQDSVVRELLAGDLASGAGYWPASVRPALPLPGFAAELRDLLLRAAERGLGPEDLSRLGRRDERPEWVAAGTFWRQYEQVSQLAGGGNGQAAAPALDAAELVAAALAELEGDEALLTAERARVRRVYVDDAQHLDPQQWRLARTLGDAAAEFVCFGDVHQSIFAFRGADPALLAEADSTGAATVTLTVSRRCPPAVRRAIAGLDARLPGTGPTELTAAGGEEQGRVAVRVLASEAAAAGWIADELHRAHLIDGVPYAEMAVLARSVPRVLPVLRRALAAAGVPVAVPADEVPLAEEPAVRPLLEVLRVAARPEALTAERAETLLSSALGGADPLARRRLRR